MVFDFTNEKTYAILLLGGKGLRLDENNPKQYIKVDNKELFVYAAEVLNESPLIDYIIYVVPEGDRMKVEMILEDFDIAKPHSIIHGGETREESSKSALDYLSSKRCNPHSTILIHDADRPNITLDLIQRNVEAAKKSQAAVTAIKCPDSLLIPKDNFVDSYKPRDFVYCVQTPQTFSYAILYSAMIRARDLKKYTDEGSLVIETTNRHPEIVMGSSANYKITTLMDLEIFKKGREKNEPQ